MRSIRHSQLEIILKGVLFWFVLYLGLYLSYLIDKAHIEAYMALGIPPRYSDRLLLGVASAEWWVLCLTVGAGLLGSWCHTRLLPLTRWLIKESFRC